MMTAGYIYLGGVVYFALLFGRHRAVHPHSFAYDLVTTAMIFAWPFMVLFGMMIRKKQ